MSQSIVKQPWEFACKWYDVDSIHRSITRPESMRQLGDAPPIPPDVNSREFAEWLADQYRLAMRKGAELATSEMQDSVVNGIESAIADAPDEVVKAAKEIAIASLNTIRSIIAEEFPNVDLDLQKEFVQSVCRFMAAKA